MLRTRALFPCLPYSESFMKRDGYVALMLDDDRYGPPWILIEPLLIHTMCFMLRYTRPNCSSYHVLMFLFAVRTPSYSCRCGGHDLLTLGSICFNTANETRWKPLIKMF
jgi:hypothetical protein